MEKSIFMEFPKESNADLYLNVFGHSITEPLHKAGPAVKSFYLIHFILDGEGDFYINNTHYKLKKGQGFLIGLSQTSPIFTCDQGDKLKKYVFDMLKHNYSNQADNYRLLGMLYLFLSVIAEAQKDKFNAPLENTYVNHAITYIQNHYSMLMTIKEISDYVGVNRSYLSSLFKEYTGMSPIKYLQNFRITRAQHMLRVTDLPIESIALSCGYQSAEAFHKIFRQLVNMSPKTFRREHRARTLINQDTMRNHKPDYIAEDAESDF